MKQRIMAIFLSLCMMIGLLPATAFAADGGELVIGDSPVIITDGGNSQENLVYDEETASITASVGDGVETPVAIGEGEVVIVPECICATEPGSLTMITESQSLTTIDGEATLELEATYSPEECVLSDGSHGEYENISYEITKVMKNEQSMSTEQYADIAGNILTVYGDDNEDPYTVYVRAKCGDVENEVYSDEIAITVNTFTSAFVSAFVSNAPEGEFYNADGELDISKGSIIITDDGYQVGESPLVGWSDSDHALTITGTSNGENNIIVQGGNPELTFNGVNITTTGSNQPAVLLYGGTGNGESRAADATIILQGDDNILVGNGAPAIQININATLTIEGDGILTTSTTANNSSAIGAGNSNAYAFTDDTGEAKTNNSYRQYGNLVIGNGTVIARGAGMGSNQYTAGIGDSYYANFGNVTVNGGTVELYNNNSNGTGISGNNIKINGGVVKDYTGGTKGGIHSDQSFTMNGGTITGNARLRGAGTISITGGNIGGYYAGEVNGRVLTKLYFVEENGIPKANTEVTVAEGEETPWTAYTDENGVVTTYLASTTEKISVEISGQSYENIVIDDNKGIIGASCTCADRSGSLMMLTKSQRLTTVDGTAALDLNAQYQKGNCALPDGFHGEYEKISYDITKVMKNGQYMSTDQYADITGNTLTVYADANKDPYTVYVQAKCGTIGAEVYSDEIAITVNTYESEASSDELDIARGSIVITDNGYTVGNGEPVAWGDSSHALTITGTSNGENNIIVQGGNPKLTFNGVNITTTGSNQPAVLLYGGTGNGESRAADATIILQGDDNILAGNDAPAIQININATLTIEGNGTLTTESNSTSAIGAGNSNAYAFTDAAGEAKTNNSYRHYGNLVIENGTVIARGSGTGTSQYIAGIGDSYYANFGNVTVNGGTVELYNKNSNGTGISGNNIVIKGGIVKDYTGGKKGGIHSDQSFTMNGGTITGNAQLRGADKISITGGNIGGYYTGDVTGRVLTKLYFVETNGKPVANTEVTVTEGEGSPWTAYTDENGIITTYLADATTEISATIDTQEYNNISVANHQALIGGDCSCSSFTGITWETGLPGSITLHNLTAGENPVSMDYDVPAAQLVTDGSCNMPIHPSLPEIEYELSVTTKDGPVVDELSGYATFRNNHLTLLPENAPYTVTLTAKAGDRQISDSITVNKGETSGGETQISTINLALGDAVINYTADGKYTYSQGDTITDQAIEGTILITGFAADGSVTVNGGSPTLVINQNDPQDVWTIYSGENAGNITLQPRTFNDKLRFGEEGSALAELSYVSATGKLKLNPDQGNITFNTDDSVTQGKFIITQLSGNIEEYVVMGGDTEAARTVTNNSSALITLEINGESVELAANGGSHSIPKADNSQIDATTKTYLFGNGDGTYTLIAAGEGDADASNYGDTQSKITAAIFDRDFTGRLRADNILYDVNLSELHAEQFSDISVKGSMLGHVYIGPNMTNISWGNYCMTTGFTVDPNNPAYTTDDKGALYSKDYSTLVVIPSQWTGSYTTHEDCTTIGGYATMRLRLDSLTIGKNVQTIEGGSYLFFSNLLSAIYVEAGNQYFASKDGILYDKEMTAILACPGKLALKELTVPETVTNVGAYIFQNVGIEKLIIPEGTEISGDRAGFTRMYNLKELEMLGSYSGYIDGAAALEKLTVYDGFNFAQNLDGDGNTPDSSMSWIKTAGITVTGGENAAYDGQSQKVEVTTNDPNLTVEYSTDGNEWSAVAPAAVSAPGTYTVYWRITKPADETYNFNRVLYSSRTFTIGGLEASEDWFTLSGPVTENKAEGTTPVTLNQPAAAPPLEDGYTVKYKSSTGEVTSTPPTTAGSYLVTVDITADGYVKETLTLGNYVILSADQTGSIVISFVTNGGNPIAPIIAASNDDITEKVNAINPTRAGYTFAGWYSDSALRNKVDSLPATMPGKHTTYYAKWTRDAYEIEYKLDGGTVSGNPEGYTAETPAFTLKNPTKPGYEFTGWTGTELSEKTKEVTIEKGSSGNRVYTANWEEIEYTITYPKDYDKVSGNKETYTINDTLNSAISLTNPSREGYSFKGWTMVVDGSTSYILPAENAEIPVGTLGNLTLSGIWLADNQTLTFHANGGKFANGTETYVISGAYDSPLSLDVTNPTRSGYRFRGWFTDEECTQLFEASNIETMPLSMNIYAGWKKKSSSSSESTEGSGTSSVSDHVVITTNSGKLTDSQIEEAVKKAEKDSVITIQAVKSDEVVLRAGAMETLVENENDLLIQLRDGEVTLPVKAMKGLIEGAKSSYEIGVSLEEQTSSDDATVSELLEKGAVIFDVVITVNGKEIHSFDKGLTLAFKVPGLKDMEEPVVLHLLQDGEQESYKPDEISGDTLTIKGIKNLSVFAVLSGNEEKAETENPFADVFENDYYFNSVLWAVTNGVTAGTSDITFSPDVTVSRAQMVTFLWRAAGSPAAEGSNPFTDVSVSDYYYNAVLWAVANGVTAGTSDTTFSPDAPVSRAQAVTFQWRAAGGPAVSGESFTDIPEGAYYAPAVTWAVANGITSGTGDHQFSPDAPVSRAQAVTFLYRQYK